jgi:hypothetical protein
MQMTLNNLASMRVHAPEKFREVARRLKIQANDVFTLLFLAALAGSLAWALDLPHFCYGLVAAGFGLGIGHIFGN